MDKDNIFRKRVENRKEWKIWFVISFWMIVVFLAVAIVYLTVVNVTQYRNMIENAYEYVDNNVEDVSADVVNMAETEILTMIERLYNAGIITTAGTSDTDAISEKLKEIYNSQGTTLSLINSDGIVIASSDPDEIGKDIHDDPEEQDFLAVLDGTIYAGFQELRPSDDDPPVMMKYVAAGLPDGSGIVQVGLDETLFQNVAMERSEFAVTNRRIGKGGYLLVAGSDQVIRNSYHNEYSWETLSDAGIIIDPDQDYFMMNEVIPVFGVLSFVCINETQGMYIVGVYPVSEAKDSMQNVMRSLLLLGVIVLAILFVVMVILIRIIIVRNMTRINSSLQKITAGDLEEKVNVRGTYEFHMLSLDINKTVDRLKGYFEEAEKRIDEDLQNAKTIQNAALPGVFPPFPEHREFEIFASMTAAKEVGGDFYDFFMLPEDKLGFLIADVSGKSIPGAMFMMRSKSLIRNLAESGLSPTEVFDVANRKLSEGNDSKMFVTAWMGYLDLKTGNVQVVNAGHNKPLLIRNGRAKYVIGRTDLMLGGMEDTIYTQQKIALQPGDFLYLYTDGVTEAMDPELQQYGDMRLRQILSFGDHPPEADPECGMTSALCNLVAGDVNNFVRGAEQSDDITMLCIRFLGNSIV